MSKEKILRNHCSLEFWIFLSYTESLTYIRIHISNDILRVRASAQQILSRVLMAVRDGLYIIINIVIYLTQEVE